jgi:hypothetical protein
MNVGLTADEILEMAKKDEARMEKELRRDRVLLPPLTMENVSATADDLQGGLLPFTGPLEDLFTCSASPEIEELLFSEESPSSPADSLFDVSSPTPTITTSSVTDQDESESAVSPWEWQAMEQMFPNVMELVAAAQANEAKANSNPFFDPEEFQRWSDLALVA